MPPKAAKLRIRSKNWNTTRYYIKNLSLSLDAHIIIHTLKVTLLGR